ncbi:MAG: hypothetical protein COB49_09880 [Alphaproteobacteria bacterium]|nr:MAG: hypothetical protein COB49_09880 [Alphaproteobacteria bacterium]
MKLIAQILIALIIGAFGGVYLANFISLNNKNVTESKPSHTMPIRADIQGYAIVTDGDTIKINGTRIRFHGIDAPEMNQPCWRNDNQYQCGRAAKDYLTELINNEPVICQYLSEDKYGRKISKCYNHENQDIEAMMVSSGSAMAYLYYSKDYERQQEEAREARIGIWAGRFEEPYQYRKNN